MVINYFRCPFNKEFYESLDKNETRQEAKNFFNHDVVSSVYCESFGLGEGCKYYNWNIRKCEVKKNELD